MANPSKRGQIQGRLIQPYPRQSGSNPVRSPNSDAEVFIDRQRLQDVLRSLESFSGE